MGGWPAALFAPVAGRDLREVQLLHHVGDETGWMVIGQPFLQGCWQQQMDLPTITFSLPLYAECAILAALWQTLILRPAELLRC